MNARDLLDRLIENGMPAARPGPGVTTAVIAGPVEVAAASRADERWLRARWKERFGNTPRLYLLLANELDGPPGRVSVLGPSRPDAAVQIVEARLLEGALKRAAKEPEALAAVRGLSAELSRLGGEGFACRDLLTRHTLERRFRGDGSRWRRASELCRRISQEASWRHVLEEVGLRVETLPTRGYLARHDGAPVAVVHPKRKTRDLTRADADGKLPEGLLLRDCRSQGARYGVLVADGRFRLFDGKSHSAASEWLELDLRLLREDRRGFMALLAPEYLAMGGLDALREEARRFGSQLHDRLDRTVRLKVLPSLAAGMGAWARKTDIDLAGGGRDDTEFDVRAYARRLEEGDVTLLDENDDAGHGGGLVAEALRAELRRAVQEREIDRLRALPWGIGAAFRQGPGVPSRGAAGIFLACRVRGDSRPYWRYVGAEGVLSAPAAILRRIDPGTAPGVADPPVDLEAAWEAAVESIVEEVDREAARDPSESIGPIQRWALGILVDPAVGEPDGSAETWEVLQVGRSQPERKALGEVRRRFDRGEISATEGASAIVEVTRDYGLRRVEPVPEKEPIEAADVGVVCWMAVL
ncbi:MAG: hypothetical protein OXH70_00745 [Acidobacteria bacterium]|nr:hypothetical protein [Acidobacteriota bacterium]